MGVGRYLVAGARLDLVGFESSRETQLRSCLAAEAEEMHKSKGKLSGVLHKGFKPDKW